MSKPPNPRSRHESLQARGRAVVARLRAKSLHFDAEVVIQLLRSNAAMRGRNPGGSNAGAGDPRK